MENELLKAIKAGNISHAYMLCADDGTLAEQCARMLLCETREGCGICQGCMLLSSRSNVDLIELHDKSIKVEAVRELLIKVAAMPRFGGYKVVHIAGCEAMTAAAQNALLKTLEEPPANVVFLFSGNENGMLPTIISRCILIRAGNAAAQADNAHTEAFSAAVKLFTSPHAQMPYYAAMDGTQLVEALSMQAAFLVDCAIAKEGEALIKKDCLSLLGQTESNGAAALAELLNETILRLKANASMRLAIARMLVKADRLRGECKK